MTLDVFGILLCLATGTGYLATGKRYPILLFLAGIGAGIVAAMVYVVFRLR